MSTCITINGVRILAFFHVDVILYIESEILEDMALLDNTIGSVKEGQDDRYQR